jgi:hypothetical protein
MEYDKPHDAIGLFDLDGSVADYDARMRDDWNALRHPDEPFVPHPHSLDSQPWAKARIRLIRRQPGWWRNLDKLQLGFDVLEIARELEFENHALTKGPDSQAAAWAEKVDWIHEHAPDLLITISQKKSLVYGKFLCDDWPKYYLPWLEVRPRGIAIVPAQPWNEDHCKHPRIIRYDGTNLAEVRAKLVELRATAS